MKKTAKILSLSLALLMVFSLFGCTPSDDKGTTTTAQGTTASQTTTSDLDKFPAIAKADIKVGVIHITSTADTSGYTYAHHKGIVEMKTALGLTDAQVIEKDDIPDTDATKTSQAIEDLIAADCNIIFATSYNYMDLMEQYAKKNKDIIFSHCSGYKSNETNFNNYFGRIYEARYLSGIAAGLKALELGVPMIGYVAAMPSSNSEVTGGINAFALGVQSVYKDCEVFVKVTNSWYEPTEEGKAAQALLDKGCVVLAQHCDSDTVQTKAQSAGKFGVGYNSDMTEVAPDSHLCAPIWNWGVYYTDAVRKAINGQWTSKNYFEGYNVGLVGLSTLNEKAIAPDTKAKVKLVEDKIKSGDFFVFTGPIVDNAGNQIIGEGEKLTDKQITGEITYYIKGVSLL